jgi:hypothetical protein
MEGLHINDDGSIDLYVGPEPPAAKESNSVASVPGEGWFSYFRLHGPTKAHFDGDWVVADFE